MNELRGWALSLTLLVVLGLAYAVGGSLYRPWTSGGPELTEAYYMLGHAFEQAGGDREAAAAWGEVVARVPAHVPARQSLLRAARRRHDWPAVAEQLRALIAIAREAGPAAGPFIARCEAELRQIEAQPSPAAGPGPAAKPPPSEP